MKQKFIVVTAISILTISLIYKYTRSNKVVVTPTTEDITEKVFKKQQTISPMLPINKHKLTITPNKSLSKQRKITLTEKDIKLNKVFKNTNKHMKNVTIKIEEELKDKNQILVVIFNPDGTNYSAIITKTGQIVRSWGKTNVEPIRR